MQELLDHLESYDININTEFYKGLLEKEKKQIKRAFEFGVGDAYNYNQEEGEEYYNQTYNQNK